MTRNLALDTDKASYREPRHEGNGLVAPEEPSPLPFEQTPNYSYQNILSKNRRMQAIFELIEQVAEATSTVLIEGETGTGKEMVARAVHGAAAGQRTGPFVAINCAAVPASLLESELFGHEKGAFTSAIGQRKGRFEMAHGGTLFLDEIGDVPAEMQAKLLRVLQERCFERVGGTETIQVDVRVVAACNRSLLQMVKAGKFREDLYYRLNVVKIDLPPLRDRREDIPLLANHFAAKYTRAGEPAKPIAADALEVLLRHSWPGNIRELENAIERACVISNGSVLDIQHLPPEVVRTPKPCSAFAIDLHRTLTEHVRNAVAQIEHDYICKALEETHGQITQCARLCGISRRSVASKMAIYHLDKNAFKRIG